MWYDPNYIKDKEPKKVLKELRALGRLKYISLYFQISTIN